MVDYKFEPTTKNMMLDMVGKQVARLEKTGKGYLRLEFVKHQTHTSLSGITTTVETHWYTRVYLTKNSKGYKATFKKGLYGGLEPELWAQYQPDTIEELKQKVTEESLRIIN